jgi:hypothetical protein
MSIVAALLETIRREIRPLMGMVEFVTDIAMDADGTATMKGAKSDDEEGHPIDAAVSWQLGFQSRPLDGASGVVVKAGGRGGVAFLVGWRNRRYELTLEKGETAMVNEAGAVVKLDKDGKITATAKTGQLVTVNGEDYALPKWDHFLSGTVTPVVPGTPYGSLSGALTHILTALTTNCVNGVPLILPATPAFVNLTDFIARVSAAEYKSTKAKNG